MGPISAELHPVAALKWRYTLASDPSSCRLSCPSTHLGHHIPRFFTQVCNLCMFIEESLVQCRGTSYDEGSFVLACFVNSTTYKRSVMRAHCGTSVASSSRGGTCSHVRRRGAYRDGNSIADDESNTWPISETITGGVTNEGFSPPIDRKQGKCDQILRPVRPPLLGTFF